uniref:Uncharacterized protein n=1 Tax=Romanomermis culicivorax TaxID=13658 RepID=A0A915K075_ROMCU
MFCALVALIILFSVLIVGVTISAIDIEVYNFGLYYALLAIVGIMISCAICIVKPPSIKNPLWYDNCCRRLASRFEPPRATTTLHETPSALRHAFNRINTVERLAPAFELVHIMLKGMATPIREEHESTHEEEDCHYYARHRSSSLPDLPKVRVVDECHKVSLMTMVEEKRDNNEQKASVV